MSFLFGEPFPALGRYLLMSPPYDGCMATIGSPAVKELRFPSPTDTDIGSRGNLAHFVSKYTIPHISTNSCKAGLGPKEISVVFWTPTERSSYNMDLRSGSKRNHQTPAGEEALLVILVTSTATTQKTRCGSKWPFPFPSRPPSLQWGEHVPCSFEAHYILEPQ